MSKPAAEIIEFNDRTLESALATDDRPLLVDFYAHWCGPCHALVPVLEDVAVERGQRVTMARINVEHCPIAARTFAIKSIPTVVILRNDLVKERLVGLRGKQEYLTAIDRTLQAG